MAAIAEIRPSDASRTAPPLPLRLAEMPACPVCADSMIAAEASALVAEDVVTYLWTCDTCGYGHVTHHTVTAFACT